MNIKMGLVLTSKCMHCVFTVYPGAHTTAAFSSLTVKYRIRIVSFFGTMQSNIFYEPPSTVLSTTVTMENRNG